MSATPEQKEEIRQLFRRHVPGIAAETVEIVSVARDVGRRSYVAVRSHVPEVEPVDACTGEHGARLKTLTAELNGEHFTVVRWEESPERFIRNAFATLHLPEVALDPAAHEALVTISRAKTVPKVGMPTEDSDVRLVAELTGWRIRLQKQVAE